MPVDAASLEGRQGEPWTMVVEVGKVAEFARATASTNPAYIGGPGEAVPAPATFLQSSAFWQGPDSSPLRDAGLDLRRILHGAQEFVFPHGVPHAGDVLSAQSRVDRVYVKEGRRGGAMTFVETVTEYRDPAGELVAESRGTLIETSRAAS